MGHPMRLEPTRVGLLVKIANRYTTKGAHECMYVYKTTYSTYFFIVFSIQL